MFVIQKLPVLFSSSGNKLPMDLTRRLRLSVKFGHELASSRKLCYCYFVGISSLRILDKTSLVGNNRSPHDGHSAHETKLWIFLCEEEKRRQIAEHILKYSSKRCWKCIQVHGFCKYNEIASGIGMLIVSASKLSMRLLSQSLLSNITGL